MLARLFKILIILIAVMSPVSAIVTDWTGFAGNSGLPADQLASNPGNWNPAPPNNGDVVTITGCQGWELLG